MATGAKTLSEISHLFLSNVREKTVTGRPVRTPPSAAQQAPRKSVDLTPEEFDQVAAPAQAIEPEEAMHIPPVRAILASHLGANQLAAIRRYAAGLAEPGKRVGLIFIDSAEFHLSTFLPGEEPMEAEETGVFDPRAMRDAINELNCDLDIWLLAVGNCRVAEGRALLRGLGHWVLLSGCDQDGLVAAYRTLKGLEDLGHPRLGIAAIDAADSAEAEATFRKLASVAGQFLSWAAESEAPIGNADGAGECQVMCCRTSHDKAQLATAAHWKVVEELIELANRTPIIEPPPMAEPEKGMPRPAPRLARIEEEPAEPGPTRESTMQIPAPLPFPPQKMMSEIIDLPEGEGCIVTAVMKHAMAELVECPVRPPMCPQARLAITRDRHILLIAEAGQGMENLNSIALAYQWLSENRALLSMAMPQFALDSQQSPHLRLIVEHGQFNAQALSPLFQSNAVSVQTYRRLRWGQRLGLLLDAA
jgi:hypothetical protein